MGFKIYLISSLCSALLLLQHATAVPAPKRERERINFQIKEDINNFSIENTLASKSLLHNLLTDLNTLEPKSALMQENIQNITSFIETVEQYEANPAFQQRTYSFINARQLSLNLNYILEYNTSPDNKTPADYEFIQASLKRSNFARVKREMLQRFKTFKNGVGKLGEDYYKLGFVRPEAYEQFLEFMNEPDLEKSYKMILPVF